MLEVLFNVENLIALLTLVALELVLGIDNIVLIAIVSGRVPPNKQNFTRRLGLALAMIMRILLLFSISWVMRLTDPLFTVGEQGVSGKDLILLIGGIFLLGKATIEIHRNLEGEEEHGVAGGAARAGVAAALSTIIAMDLVFSLDSVITAVGMVDHISIMILAVILAVALMMVFAGPVSRFIHHHPTIKMLALSFMLLIGVMLLLEGLHHHIDKKYIYFAMGFSLVVEMLNLKLIKPHKIDSASAATTAQPPAAG